jgi:hypothetical protein
MALICGVVFETLMQVSREVYKGEKGRQNVKDGTLFVYVL